MSKTPDFSRKPTAVPPRASRPQLPQTPLGDRPLPRGEVLVGTKQAGAQVTTTDWVSSQLKSVGWNEGDPIPPNLADRIAQIQRELTEDRLGMPVPADFQQSFAETVPIDQMPDDYKQEIARVLKDYKTQCVREEAEARMIAEAEQAGVNPSVAAAERAAAAAASAATPGDPHMPEVVLVSRPPQPQKPPPQVQVPEGKTLGGVTGIHPIFNQVDSTGTIQPKPGEAEPPPTVEHPPGLVAGAGGAPPLHKCPRCDFPLDVPFDVEITPHDRNLYVAAILGQQRFRKTYDLFGGRVRVTFRDMSSKETELMFVQLGHDTRANRISGDGEYFMRMADYRLAMMVEQVDFDKTVNAMPEVMKIPYDPPENGEPETVLVQAVDWFIENVLPQDSLRKLVARHHRQFQRLLETLEAQAVEPGFWEEIGR